MARLLNVDMTDLLTLFAQEQPMEFSPNLGGLSIEQDTEALQYLGEFVEWLVEQGFQQSTTTEQSWEDVFKKLGLGGYLADAWEVVIQCSTKLPTGEY